MSAPTLFSDLWVPRVSPLDINTVSHLAASVSPSPHGLIRAAISSHFPTLRPSPAIRAAISSRDGGQQAPHPHVKDAATRQGRAILVLSFYQGAVSDRDPLAHLTAIDIPPPVAVVIPPPLLHHAPEPRHLLGNAART